MNAIATSTADNGAVYSSDSDSNSDDSPEYYQPISTVDSSGGDGGDEEGGGVDLLNRDPNPNFHHLPNGWMENGLSPLDLSDGDEIDEEEEEAENEAIESERAIERAFREDERRRNAPLTAETSVRVMEAMRGVSFSGVAPEWASQVAEDEWIDRLRRLRRESSAAAMDQ